MDNRIITEQTETRINIPRNQKAWKYIRDVTNTNVRNLNRKALVDGMTLKNRTILLLTQASLWKKGGQILEEREFTK